MQQENAQLIGVKALGWIATQDEVFEAFIFASGARPEELRARAEEPEFLVSVLDFLLMQDEWVLGFAQATGSAPEQVMQARIVLGGGDMAHWT